MSYDRRSEPRRSLSGRRANYGGRRDGRSDGRSPDYRLQRGGNYYRSTHQNRIHEYGDRYRHKSPSDARYARDARGHRYGRSAAYHRSRTPSPRRRRSRSLEQYSRSEKFSQRDAPSARFGSKASYLRSRGTYRGSSRSASRSGRRQSSVLREQEERPDVGSRSGSRGRYRGRRDDYMERSRRRPSSERQPPKSRRSNDRCEPSYHRGRRPRHSLSPVRHEAIGRFAGRHRPEHGVRHREPSTDPRERKASERRRSSSRTRGAASSRSVSRPVSGCRDRIAASISQRSRQTEGSHRPRSYSGSKGLRDASASVDQQSSTVRQRSHDGARQDTDELSRRRSLDRCRRSSQHSFTGSRPRDDAMSSRPSRSSSHRKSFERSHDASKEQTEDVHNRRSDQQEQTTRKASPSRSLECPTPDLALSRSSKAEGDQRHCADGKRMQQSELELFTKPVDGDVVRASRERDSLDRGDKCASGISEVREHVFEAHEVTSPPTEQSKARRSVSIVRTPSQGRTDAGDDNQTKKRGRSCSPAPAVKEQVPSERDIGILTDSSELPTAGDAPDDHGIAPNTALDQHKDDGAKTDEDLTTVESKKVQSMSLRSPGLRRRSSSVPRPALQQDPNNAAADPIPDSQADERSEARPMSNSECVERTRGAGRNLAKRRIVAAEPQHTSVDSEEIYRRAPSPWKNFRTPRQIPTRGDRLYFRENRLQPALGNRWSRLEVEVPFDHPQAHYRTSATRSVRLVGAYTDRPPFFTPPHPHRNIAPVDARPETLYNKAFHRAGPAHFPHRARACVPFPGAGGRKMAEVPRRGAPARRHAPAAGDADGKWNHDLYEQLTSEPERKRPRFNLYVSRSFDESAF